MTEPGDNQFYHFKRKFLFNNAGRVNGQVCQTRGNVNKLTRSGEVFIA